MLPKIPMFAYLYLLSAIAQAELASLTESELSDVTGEGIGLVYENYQLEMLSEDLNARTDGASGTLPGGGGGNKPLVITVVTAQTQKKLILKKREYCY